MIIKNICLNNFRNLKQIYIEPHQNMNILCGENAQGKTNLIEAIWLFTGAKSFRNSKENEMISFDCKKTEIEINFISEGIEKTAKIIIDDKKNLFLNDKKIKSASEFAGNFNAIVFSPTDLSLIIDGPAIRRRFLDVAIGQLYPRYIEILKNYNRAVMQRNNILKDCYKDASLKFLLDDYEEVIINCGEKIINYRKKYIEQIKKTAPKIYEGISQKKEILDIEYICSSDGKGLREKLKLLRNEDIYKGVTSVGPHRDDIIFKINSINCRDFGSQGQKRSVALALKLSEAEIIKEITGEQPIALLDDVMSELDKSRQDYILNHIDGWQVFITCCETGHFENLNEGKIFTVKNGEIF